MCIYIYTYIFTYTNVYIFLKFHFRNAYHNVIIMNTFKDLIKLKDAYEGNIVNLFSFF